MQAKMIKLPAGLEHHHTLGKTYEIKNNNIDPADKFCFVTDRGYDHFIDEKFYSEHFEAVFSPSASDFVFNFDGSHEFAAQLLNGIICENGGFACYTAEDVVREYTARV